MVTVVILRFYAFLRFNDSVIFFIGRNLPLGKGLQRFLVSSESSELPHQFEADFIFGLPLQQKSSDSRAKRDAGFPLASRKAS